MDKEIHTPETNTQLYNTNGQIITSSSSGKNSDTIYPLELDGVLSYFQFLHKRSAIYGIVLVPGTLILAIMLPNLFTISLCIFMAASTYTSYVISLFISDKKRDVVKWVYRDLVLNFLLLIAYGAHTLLTGSSLNNLIDVHNPIIIVGIGLIIYSLIVVIYFHRSKRVKATLIR